MRPRGGPGGQAVDRAADALRAREAAAGEGGPEGLNAFLAVPDAEAVRRQAEAAEGPLAGVPVAVKDNLVTLDLPTTCASRLLEGYRSPYEATAVRRLREAGAVVVGKTNLDEFGMGSSNENSAFGPVLNPLDRTRVPGGSSGGSAAAVAAGIVPLALGSDTGGSVRQPAAFCGVVGFKPTYGRVSRYGLVAYASSLDQVGVLGRRVADAAAGLEAVAGHDPRDATSAPRDVPELRVAAARGAADGARPDGLADLRIGLPREYLPADLDPGVREAFEGACEALRAAGARLVDVSLPSTPYAVPAYYVIATAEASSNLARFDGVRFGRRAPDVETGPEGAADADVDAFRAMVERTRSWGFGREVRRRIVMGAFVLSAGYNEAYYGRACRVRRRLAAEFGRVFASEADVLLTPTAPGVAFTLGERLDDPLAMYLSDIYTVTANLAGLPALSLPVGVAGGLPVGGQLLGPPWSEAPLVRVAAALERALG
ncbi:MAG: Asp-tRNA(Asn)/Glu-tRNA(Gln) amidotransferase subunit GatA, partial [Gemmatimonadetes bacterium]